jgi:hypothetical protein
MKKHRKLLKSQDTYLKAWATSKKSQNAYEKTWETF